MPTDVCSDAVVAGHGPPWCWAQLTATPVGHPSRITRPQARLGAAVPRRGGGLVLCLPDGPTLLDPDGATRTTWRWLVSLYGAGRFDPSPLITHRFSLDQVDEAFRVLGDRSAGALKVLIEPNRPA